MSFLQPLLLLALPLAALPIIIHLINQRRYQSIRWAAMMFLLAANRMSRGFARIRQWLILAFRVLALAALCFVISRPLSGGWLGMAGSGRPDTTLILFDRSPSMQQGGSGGSDSKVDSAKRQLEATFETLGSSRWVLVESATNKAREIESAKAIMSSPSADPVSASSDIAAMLESARDYIRANKPGRSDIWICSDLRENDWNVDSARWHSLRETFLEQPQGLRFHLLASPKIAPGNISVRVTDVRRQKTGDSAALLISLRLLREVGEDAKTTVPIHFEVEGARSELTVEMIGPRFDLKDHRIPLDKNRERGWGKVSIPADANLADNEFWFTFDRPVPRHAVIVSEDTQASRPFELAAQVAPEPEIRCSAEVIGPDQLATVDWDKTCLLIWHAPLPENDAAKKVQGFLDRGGQVMFLPPKNPTSATFLGTKWTSWVSGPNDIAIESWRGDQDLLANTQSGAALPVGQLQIRRYCRLDGEFTPLWTVKGGAPLLARVTTNRGGAYFCATTPASSDSSLAVNGVVLYVLTHRALAAGALSLGNTRQLIAGEPSGEDLSRWRRLSGTEEAVSTEFSLHRGVYAAGDRLVAVNRSAEEDAAKVVPDARIAGLFRGLDFRRIDEQSGGVGSLVQEIWRLFLTIMMVAMVVEAGLCLPKRTRAPVTGGTP
jgi:hypothetical protein